VPVVRALQAPAVDGKCRSSGAGRAVPCRLPPPRVRTGGHVADVEVCWPSDATLTTLPEILDHTQPGYHDTASPTDPESIGHLPQPAIGGSLPQPTGALGAKGPIPGPSSDQSNA